MDNHLELTAADRCILASYGRMLEGLADYLGPGYEIVLHSLEDIDHSAVKVLGGHYTGRREGAPLTDLGLELLTEISGGDAPPTGLTYVARSKKGAPVRSTTIPILGENNRMIGLLCLNLHTDTPLHAFLEHFTRPGNAGAVTETFSHSTDELVLSMLEQARLQVQGDETVPAANRNREIIAILHRKGVFNRKDAVVRVAGHLGLSKNTVYMHIRNLAKNNQA